MLRRFARSFAGMCDELAPYLRDAENSRHAAADLLSSVVILLLTERYRALVRQRRAAWQPGGQGFAGVVLRPLWAEAATLLRCDAWPRPPTWDAPDAMLLPLLDQLLDEPWQPDELQSAGLTPAVLGMLLEQQLDNKRHGAYYTADDVADYLAHATVVPALFELAGPGALADADALVRQEPRRFLHAALLGGCDTPLPPEVAAGCDDPSLRDRWNQAAPPPYGLPGETWREHIARRAHVELLLARLGHGPPLGANDMISANLDVARLAEACIAAADRATHPAWQRALANLSVLDPTCGGGALVLAALRVLVPLHRVCAERACALGFAPVPDEAALRATAIRQNLHGLDLMPEAAEVTRLRLRLAVLAAGGMPDVDDAVLVGDALRGAVRSEDVANADPSLFHWHRGWPEVIGRGGFDAVIGNPPYLPSRQSPLPPLPGYATAGCGNLYAPVVERALALLRPNGRCGMIVPVASLATDAMRPLQQLYAGRAQWHSHYAVRPGKLFGDVDMNLTITLLGPPAADAACHTTGYQRWSDGPNGGRAHLFATLHYQPLPPLPGHRAPFAKLGSPLEASLLRRMLGHGRYLHQYATTGGTTLFYHSGGRYWRKALFQRLSSHYRPITVPDALGPVVFALLNSQLFYWYWIAHSNCMDVVLREVFDLPVFALERADHAAFAAAQAQVLAAYEQHSSVRQRRGPAISTDERQFAMARAKPQIDTLDTLLADHYGFSADERDFVLNYDIKYRCR